MMTTGHSEMTKCTPFTRGKVPTVRYCIKPGLEHPKGLYLYNMIWQAVPCIEELLISVWNLPKQISICALLFC